MCVSFTKEIVVPEIWQFEEARKRFATPEVLDCKKIKVMDFRMVCMYHICVIDTFNMYDSDVQPHAFI